MAGVISISSDEESEPRSTGKKRKLSTSDVILLDDDVPKKSTEDDKMSIALDSDAEETENVKNDEMRLTNGAMHSISLDSDHERSDASEETVKINEAIDSDFEEAFERYEMHVLKTVKDTSESNCSKSDSDKSDVEKKDDSEHRNKRDTTELFDNCEEINKLVEICLSKLPDEDSRNLVRQKIPTYKRMFEKVGRDYIESSAFKEDLTEKIKLAQKSSLEAVQCFNDVYFHLQGVHKRSDDQQVEKNHEAIIRKLNTALRRLRKRIKIIEEEEIDFDDEDDSAFIKLDRYQTRAVKVYEKLCKYLKDDPNSNRLLYNRLDFSASKYPQINKALNRKYTNNSVFPSYFDVEKYIRKCIAKNDIQMSEAMLKSEARSCFEKLGNLMQTRRKIELMSIHSDYLETNVDPAGEDPELNAKLLSSYKEFKTKTDDICQKYAQIQETGEEPQLSSDSDDSQHPDSGDDENEEL